jgi:hypothetical protein
VTPDQQRIADLEAEVAALRIERDGWAYKVYAERDRMGALVHGRFMRFLETAYAAITDVTPHIAVVEERIDECLKLMRVEKDRLDQLQR